MMILLEESTTEQLINELKSRAEYMAILINKDSNEQEFITAWKGTYIQKMGMAHLLKTEMESIDIHYHFENLKSNQKENEEDDDIF